MPKIKCSIPKRLKEKGVRPQDVSWDLRISLNTAKRYFDEDEVNNMDSVSFPVLSGFCKFFGCGVGDLFEYAPEVE